MGDMNYIIHEHSTMSYSYICHEYRYVWNYLSYVVHQYICLHAAPLHNWKLNGSVLVPQKNLYWIKITRNLQMHAAGRGQHHIIHILLHDNITMDN